MSGGGGGGGRFYWVRNRAGEFRPKGIVVVFVWVSISDVRLKVFIDLCFSLGWNSLVCRADFLNPFVPGRATSLGFSILREIVKELRSGLCPVVLASFSGGSKACLYKFLQIIDGCSEVEINPDESRLLASCISAQIYDSDPIDVSTLGSRLGLHTMPGSSKLLSLFARGVTTGMDALFITDFRSQQQECLQTLYSSVSLGAPFLVLSSEDDDADAYSALCGFVQHLRDSGGCAKMIKYGVATDAGRGATEHAVAAIGETLEQSASIFVRKIHRLGGENSLAYDAHDQVCDLQNAAVDSNQSFGRIAVGPEDHFFIPSSFRQEEEPPGCSNDERRRDRSPHRSAPRMNPNSALGQVLFDVCVPKNIEGWDIKFTGSVNGDPHPSVRKRSPFWTVKRRSRL